MEEGQLRMLLKWRARCKRAQLAHNYTAISYHRYHVTLGVMLIILTTSGSVITFADFNSSYSWVPVVVSVTATLFATLQTFMKFSDQAELHRTAGRKYGELKKEIEYIINFEAESRGLHELVCEVKKKETELNQESQNTPRRHWKKAKNKTIGENEKFSLKK